ncbi:MAG: hypothetical protein ACI9FJ_000645 [Alteromonadaceae bacterium]|jgi:hypothetical protein
MVLLLTMILLLNSTTSAGDVSGGNMKMDVAQNVGFKGEPDIGSNAKITVIYQNGRFVSVPTQWLNFSSRTAPQSQTTLGRSMHIDQSLIKQRLESRIK